MTPPPPLLLDTGAILSLYASRRMEAILRANLGPFLIAEAVLHEALYIHVIVDGVREKEPISLDSLLAAGILAPVAPETEAEFETLLDYSRQLDDGEAMTCAIALHRGYRIATDDKKTIRLMGSRVPLTGTLDLIRIWTNEAAAPPLVVREMVLAIVDRGYVPGPAHVHYDWWITILGGYSGEPDQS